MVIIITDVSYDRDGYKFWSGSENVTADLRELMHDAKADWFETHEPLSGGPGAHRDTAAAG